MPTLKATMGIEIEDGVYKATLVEIEFRDPTPNSPNQDQWLSWKFLVDYDGEDLEMRASSSMNFGPKAKCRKWSESLLGRKFERGEEFDPETLPPKDCQVVIKNDPDSGFARIEDVIGIRRKQATMQKGKQPGADQLDWPKERDGVEV